MIYRSVNWKRDCGCLLKNECKSLRIDSHMISLYVKEYTFVSNKSTN